MDPEQLRLLILGAHPDDAEFHAGGLITRYCGRGHVVRIISVTDGAAGHHRASAEELVTIRRREAAAVTQLLDVDYEIWDFPDGQLQPTMAVRERIIREIRTFRPDLVLTHRPCDYHPDHRAVGLAVQDATYLVTVPLVLAQVPALRRDPAVVYMVDFFTRPYPFQGDVVLDVTAEFETVIELLDCHASQVYEWLPYNMGILDQVPPQKERRKSLLRDWFATRSAQVADRFRSDLERYYGPQRGRQIDRAEAYEISEYAAQLDDAARRRLFLIDDRA
jgi:LmbE family N-acetylglucosaminyl deacetylase